MSFEVKINLAKAPIFTTSTACKGVSSSFFEEAENLWIIPIGANLYGHWWHWHPEMKIIH
jgi:hypothetical protein